MFFLHLLVSLLYWLPSLSSQTSLDRLVKNQFGFRKTKGIGEAVCALRLYRRGIVQLRETRYEDFVNSKIVLTFHLSFTSDKKCQFITQRLLVKKPFKLFSTTSLGSRYVYHSTCFWGAESESELCKQNSFTAHRKKCKKKLFGCYKSQRKWAYFVIFRKIHFLEFKKTHGMDAYIGSYYNGAFENQNPQGYIVLMLRSF